MGFNQLEKPNKSFKLFTLKRGFLPSYSGTKKIPGYKSELRRTLLGGKFLSFENQKTLDEVAKRILTAKHAKLRFLIQDIRYSSTLQESENHQIGLSQNGKELLLLVDGKKAKVLMKFS